MAVKRTMKEAALSCSQMVLHAMGDQTMGMARGLELGSTPCRKAAEGSKHQGHLKLIVLLFL